MTSSVSHRTMEILDTEELMPLDSLLGRKIRKLLLRSIIFLVHGLMLMGGLKNSSITLTDRNLSVGRLMPRNMDMIVILATGC